MLRKQDHSHSLHLICTCANLNLINKYKLNTVIFLINCSSSNKRAVICHVFEHQQLNFIVPEVNFDWIMVWSLFTEPFICLFIGYVHIHSTKWQLTYWQNLKWHLMPDKMAGKLITSNIASARNQWYSKDSVFWLAQKTYIME